MITDRYRVVVELAQQAGYQKDSFGFGHWDMPEFKKYTELLIEECNMLGKEIQSQTIFAPEEYIAGREMGVEVFMNRIRRHFGVDE